MRWQIHTSTGEEFRGSMDTSEELIQAMLRPETTRQSFFLLYSRLLELRCGARELRYEEPDTLSLKTAEGGEHKLHLENLWIQSRQDLAEGREVIERYVSVVSGFGKEIEAARDAVVPLVKDQTYIDFLGEENSVPIEHLAADLWIVYAVDRDINITSLTEKEMVALELTHKDLRDLATENLRNILPPVECHGEGPWFLLTAGGDYVASLLLLDSVWQFAAEEAKGDVVAVAPTRDAVLFTNADSVEGLAEIRRRAKELVSTSDHVVSPTLLRRIGNGWVAFD
jgi:uncharacterized protein YtpQ (UPF0354 family)